ncbi:MAG: hemolysin family protein [Euzebya tangerina]|nr:hemolysin family protein [Euzebya tangerina]
MTALGLLLIVALIAGNAWFVAAEFALVAARRSRLEARRDAGDRKAAIALGLIERLSFALSGAQLGITVTSLAVGFVAEPVFEALLTPLFEPLGASAETTEAAALGTGLALSTAAQMVFGELGPKNLAIARAEDVSRRLAWGQELYLRLWGPIIRLFDNAANRLIRSVGIEPAEELTQAVTIEELEHIIATSGESGALNEGVASLLQRSIDFRELKADEAMRPRSEIQWVAGDATCDELMALARSTGHTRFPVAGENGLDDVRGVVSIKELMDIAEDQLAITPVGALTEDELAVPETALLPDVLRLLRDSHTQLAVVIDEFGGTAGIITLEDIVEELVGEILDEHDPFERSPVRRDDGSWRLPGTWRIDEVRRDTGVELPEGEHDTVAGLVMAELGRVPEPGDRVELDGAVLDVLAMERHTVQSVRLMVTAEDGGQPADAGHGEVAP